MNSKADILEQLIELDEVLPEIEMGCVPDKPFGTVSVLSKPVNVGAVDFGRDLPPHPDFERWEIEGMCQDGGCEVCNPDLCQRPYDYDDYGRWEDESESTEDMLWRKSVEDTDRIAELESRVRNLEWQIRALTRASNN